MEEPEDIIAKVLSIFCTIFADTIVLFWEGLHRWGDELSLVEFSCFFRQDYPLLNNMFDPDLTEREHKDQLPYGHIELSENLPDGHQLPQLSSVRNFRADVYSSELSINSLIDMVASMSHLQHLDLKFNDVAKQSQSRRIKRREGI